MSRVFDERFNEICAQGNIAAAIDFLDANPGRVDSYQRIREGQYAGLTLVHVAILQREWAYVRFLTDPAGRFKLNKNVATESERYRELTPVGLACQLRAPFKEIQFLIESTRLSGESERLRENILFDTVLNAVGISAYGYHFPLLEQLLQTYETVLKRNPQGTHAYFLNCYAHIRTQIGVGFELDEAHADKRRFFERRALRTLDLLTQWAFSHVKRPVPPSIEKEEDAFYRSYTHWLKAGDERANLLIRNLRFNPHRIVEISLPSSPLMFSKTNKMEAAFYAAYLGKMEPLRILLETRRISVTPPLGALNLAMAAAFGGRVEAVQYLSTQSGFDINAKDSEDYTLLHYAIASGKIDMVWWVLERWPELLERADEAKTSPLLFSISCGHWDIFQLLWSYSGITSETLPTLKNNYGDTALECAVQNGHEAIFRFLIGQGADYEAEAGSLLTRAVAGNQPAMLRLLVETYGFRELLFSELGTLLLIDAARSGYLEIVEMLLNWGVPINSRGSNNARDDYDRTAYGFALGPVNVEVATLLHNRGAHLSPQDISNLLAYTHRYFQERHVLIGIPRDSLKADLDAQNQEQAIQMFFGSALADTLPLRVRGALRCRAGFFEASSGARAAARAEAGSAPAPAPAPALALALAAASAVDTCAPPAAASAVGAGGSPVARA